MSGKSRRAVGSVGRSLGVALVGSLVLPSLLYAQADPYEKGLQAYLKRDYRNAARYLKEHVAKKPDAQAYYLLGYANYKLKNKEEAMEYFREAYLVDPQITGKRIGFKK